MSGGAGQLCYIMMPEQNTRGGTLDIHHCAYWGLIHDQRHLDIHQTHGH